MAENHKGNDNRARERKGKKQIDRCKNTSKQQASERKKEKKRTGMSLRLGKKERGKEKQKASGSVHGIRSNQNGSHVAVL